MLSISGRSIRSKTEASLGCHVESLHTRVRCTLLVSAPQEGHGGVKTTPEASQGTEPVKERRASLGLLPRGERDTTKVPRVAKRLWPIAALRQPQEVPFQQTFVQKGRSLIALMWLCSCQRSGEAMMMTTRTLHLRTTRSPPPQLFSLW